MEEIIYKILIAGIDTLEIGYCIVKYHLSQEEWDMLEEAKGRAQSTLYDKGTGVRFQGYDFVVSVQVPEDISSFYPMKT